MGDTIIYSVNIASEATMLIVMLLLLFTLHRQRKTFASTGLIIVLTNFVISILVVQIITWVFLILDVPVKYGVMPMRIAFTLDYFFLYATSVLFYYYVENLTIEGYKELGVVYNPKANVKKFIVVWGVVTTLLYAFLPFWPELYRIENGEVVYSVTALICVHVVSKLAFMCAIIHLVRYRKAIGNREAAFCLNIIVIISICLVLDELLEICVGRVLTAFFTLVFYMSIDLNREVRLERQEREIVEWKTQIMLSQMQPHFLYNVLTTISSLCEMQNAMQARDVVNRFAEYFRTNLDSLGKERIIPFERELEHVKTYLWLEKVRFEDKLNVYYEIGPMDFSVPSLSVQPMVENAVKHGILPKEDDGILTIKTIETEYDYEIIIEDDGVGFDKEKALNDGRTHIGIENVSRRLEIICNGSCDIESKKGIGTVVTIHIPKGD